MGKKKKKDVYEEAEREGTTIEDYIIPQKVQAFIDAYEPVAQQKFATTIFDETKLRAFFKAYIAAFAAFSSATTIFWRFIPSAVSIAVT